jgi:hypothetical protein
VPAFADSVSLKSLAVQDPPGYVFLCGGKLTDLDHSLRAQFYERRVKPDPILARRVKLAEVADEWYSTRKLFDNLLELEECLAGLSACILLFVESPGAIAELGAFSQMLQLRQKLLVVVEQSHFRQSSFIRNGPLEQLFQMDEKCLLPYPWLVDLAGGGSKVIDPATLDAVLDGIARALAETLAAKRKTIPFDTDDVGHKMLLVTDLVKLGVVSQQKELLETLRELGTKIEKRSLVKYLYLLEQLELVVSLPYGHNVFYVSPVGTRDHIRYAHKDPAIPLDRIKLRGLLHKDFPPNDEKREAFDAFWRRGGGVAP